MAISFHEGNSRRDILDYWKGEVIPNRIEGAPGVALVELLGKRNLSRTGLVDELVQEASVQSMVTSRVDLRDYLYSDKTSEFPTWLSVALLRQLPADTADFFSALAIYNCSQAPEKGVVSAYNRLDQETRLYKRPDWLTAYRQVAIEQIKCVNQLARPVLQVLENIDTLSNIQRDHLEEWFVSPMMFVPGNLLLITNSKHYSKWDRLQVRNVYAPLRVK